MVPNGQEQPKAADFIHWSELIADTICGGSHGKEIRKYLKCVARSTWQLVSWLTHAANATKYDGTTAIDATYAVLNAYGAALLRYERPTTDRCARCGSQRVQVIYMPDSDDSDRVVCETCGWNEPQELTGAQNRPEQKVQKTEIRKSLRDKGSSG
jgi:hypothetical protein